MRHKNLKAPFDLPATVPARAKAHQGAFTLCTVDWKLFMCPTFYVLVSKLCEPKGKEWMAETNFMIHRAPVRNPLRPFCSVVCRHNKRINSCGMKCSVPRMSGAINVRFRRWFMPFASSKISIQRKLVSVSLTKYWWAIRTCLRFCIASVPASG